ncbi:MAG: caspase family protein [Deltaproteobacteria bacterium]|nr:caspase family protein [Deltaproteobacteria bacterium]
MMAGKEYIIKGKGALMGKLIKSMLLMFFSFLMIIIQVNQAPCETGGVEIFPQLGHTGRVTSLDLSPDGQYVLSGNSDSTVKLWDGATGKEIRTFPGHSGLCVSAVFSNSGKRAISVGHDGTARVWEIESGKQLKVVNTHMAGVTTVAVDRKGRHALLGNNKGKLVLWNVETGDEVRKLRGHSGSISEAAFSPDGKYVLTWEYVITTRGLEPLLKVWDIATGNEIRSFSDIYVGLHTDPMKAVFSPDGKYVLTGGADGKNIRYGGPGGKYLISSDGDDYILKLWEIAKGDRVMIFSGHTGKITSLAFSPDGRYVYSGSMDKTIRQWDVATGKELRRIAGFDEGGVYAIKVTPDGRELLAGSWSGELRMWDIESAETVQSFKGYADSVITVSVSPDGKRVLSGSSGKSFHLWDIEAGRELQALTLPSGTASFVSFGRDGKHAFSANDESIKMWDLESGKEVRTIATKQFGIAAQFALSPDNHYMMSGGFENTARLWDLETGKEVRTFSGHSSKVISVVFSADGRYALSGSYDEKAKLWNVATGKEIWTFEGHSGMIFAVAFSPDGKYAVSGGLDKTFKLWEMETGKVVRTFKKHGAAIIRAKFSPEGKSILTAGTDGKLKLWDMKSGKELKTFNGHEGMIYSIDFSRDGRLITSGGKDGSTRLWDAASGKELVRFIGFADGEWVVMTPDGYFNASKSGPSHLTIRKGNQVFGLDQFYDVFYRPDIVEAGIKGEDVSELAAANLAEAIRNPPPTVEFINVPSETGETNVSIKYKITSSGGGGIGEVRLFHNGKLIQSDGFYRQANIAPTYRKATLIAYNSRAIKDDLRSVSLVSKKEDKPSLIESAPKGDVYEGSITVDAISGENDIGLAAFNRNNSVQSILKTATFKSTLKPEDSHLYILSVGIDEYKARENNLRYAVKDAESIVQKLQEQSTTQYEPENIHILTIKNSDATKTNILSRTDELSNTIKPNDVFVLFIASHGVLQSGLYSIVSHDYSGSLNSSNLISSNEIMEISKKMKALRQVFILDTCHAGGLDNFVSGLYDARMTVMAKNMGLHMFASASSTQEAMDGYKGENGMFTYTLLEGLNNNRNADTNGDSRISIYELGSYSKEQTTKYSKESGHTQTPVVNNYGKDISVYMIR